MKLTLNVHEQYGLFELFKKLDMLKLGADRLALHQNIQVLKDSLAPFETARTALDEEIWPNGKPGKTQEEWLEKDPVNAARHKVALMEMASATKELDLTPLSRKALYHSDNEISFDVITFLMQQGLLESAPAPAPAA